MIKANELRIGNYVLVNGKQEKVFSISDDGINHTVDNLGHFPITEFETWDKVKPVPITDKILLKSGFVLIKKIDSFSIWSFGIDKLFTYETESNFVMLDNHKLSKCEYFHEIQNAFFVLTGEEIPYINK